ncbi:hypothetical protein ACP70R_012421 [Stipagrostis hirtigluma subsp. patula]
MHPRESEHISRHVFVVKSPRDTQMQPVSRLAPVRPQSPLPLGLFSGPPRAAAVAGTCPQHHVWVATSRGAAGLRVRARGACGGREPVEAQRREEEAELAAEELEVLEEKAIAGEDEGRRPTDYDRRAHIFEESSRVFRALKQRRDGGGGGQDGRAATAGTATREQQQLGCGGDAACSNA